MPILANKPAPAFLRNRRSGVGAIPFTDALRQQIMDAAVAGATPGMLTGQLRALGYTMADISALYNVASSTATFTPQVLQWLQSENAVLQEQLNSQNRLWMFLGFGALAVYLYTTPARKR